MNGGGAELSGMEVRGKPDDVNAWPACRPATRLALCRGFVDIPPIARDGVVG
jgi:imidazolonepropionase-like amidohydrolase